MFFSSAQALSISTLRINSLAELRYGPADQLPHKSRLLRMAAAKVSYGALKTEENNDPNGLKSASFDEEGVEVRTKPSGSRRTILAVVVLALGGTALLACSAVGGFSKG